MKETAMRVFLASGLGLLAALYAYPVQALSITNTDPDPHTITVTAGGNSQELTIEPDKEVEPPCDKGCVVELDGGDQYEMQGGEDATIENDAIFVDEAPGAGDDDENDDDSAGEGPDSPSDDATSPDQNPPPPSGPDNQ
jgi:hypothetical protein